MVFFSRLFYLICTVYLFFGIHVELFAVGDGRPEITGLSVNGRRASMALEDYINEQARGLGIQDYIHVYISGTDKGDWSAIVVPSRRNNLIRGGVAAEGIVRVGVIVAMPAQAEDVFLHKKEKSPDYYFFCGSLVHELGHIADVEAKDRYDRELRADAFVAQHCFNVAKKESASGEKQALCNLHVLRAMRDYFLAAHRDCFDESCSDRFDAEHAGLPPYAYEDLCEREYKKYDCAHPSHYKRARIFNDWLTKAEAEIVALRAARSVPVSKIGVLKKDLLVRQSFSALSKDKRSAFMWGVGGVACCLLARVLYRSVTGKQLPAVQRVILKPDFYDFFLNSCACFTW